MIHYSCDLCGKNLTSDDLRYVVKMDVHAALTPPAASVDDDSDVDHLEELGDMLEQEMLGDEDPVALDGPHEIRHDLCPECCKKFLKDPLGRESVLKQLNFSVN
jgi:hypothetical protein